MKKLVFIFSILTNLLLGQGPSCNMSALIPDVVFYPGISSTPSYTPYAQYYLCDSATVYDTILGGDLQIFISPGATYFWKGGERRSALIYIKNGGTLNVIPTGWQSGRIIVVEPGATINDPANLNGPGYTPLTCSSITFPFINCFTGINEINRNKITIKLYPNPNNGSFKLQVDSDIKNGELILVNSLGQKVYGQKITQGENQIITNNLAKGLYHYLILENKNQVSEGKIAIE